MHRGARRWILRDDGAIGLRTIVGLGRLDESQAVAARHLLSLRERDVDEVGGVNGRRAFLVDQKEDDQPDDRDHEQREQSRDPEPGTRGGFLGLWLCELGAPAGATGGVRRRGVGGYRAGSVRIGRVDDAARRVRTDHAGGGAKGNVAGGGIHGTSRSDTCGSSGSGCARHAGGACGGSGPSPGRSCQSGTGSDAGDAKSSSGRGTLAGRGGNIPGRGSSSRRTGYGEEDL